MSSCDGESGAPERGKSGPTTVVVGVNHKDTPISLRERLSMLPSEVPEILARIQALDGVEEVVALSTCNRVELYASLGASEEASVLERLAASFCQARGVPFDDVKSSLYEFTGLDAVRHLLEVACGLDSMVPGENQVFSQVKDAYRLAAAAGTSGPGLSRLFQRSFKAAKDVRSRTGISRRQVSIATVVVDLARRVFGRLGGVRVVLVGAGEMAELTLEALVSEGVRTAAVANRSVESAERLTSRFGGEAVGLDGVEAEILRADILVASAAAPGVIIAVEGVERAVHVRRGRPMLLVDLGVPRNMDPEAAQLDGVILYDIDDLQAVVAQNLAYRLEQADQARSLIAEEVRKFAALLGADEVSGTIARLSAELTQIGEDECDSALRRLESLADGFTDGQRREVKLMARRIVRKILHSPIDALKQEGRAGDATRMDDTVRRLFKL